MNRRVLTIVLRAALLVAIVASAALFVDYSRPAPAFCAAASGCGKVRAWSAGHLGEWLPAVGLGVFVGLYAVTLGMGSERHLRWLSWAMAAVALGAIGLIGLQVFWVGAVCQWCMAADGAAVVGSVAAFGLRRTEAPAEPRAVRIAWALVGSAAVAVPLTWGSAAARTTLPHGVAGLQVPGKVNIVTFTDFECPFCRRLHPELHRIVAASPERFHVVRKMVPLRGHPGAEPAAKAYLCVAPELRDALADRLYQSGPEELTDKGVAAIAKELGADVRAFVRCFGDAATAEQIAADRKLFGEAGLKGLPSTFVDDRLVEGASVEELLGAVDAALSGGGGNDPRYMFGLLLVVFAAAAALSFKLDPVPAAEPGEPAEPEEPGGEKTT